MSSNGDFGLFGPVQHLGEKIRKIFRLSMGAFGLITSLEFLSAGGVNSHKFHSIGAFGPKIQG
ncbi:hypothetical protein OROGR_002150 [Orobanche gracilis]